MKYFHSLYLFCFTKCIFHDLLVYISDFAVRILMDKHNWQTLEDFIQNMSVSLTQGIISSVNNSIKLGGIEHKNIILYGASDDILRLVSCKIDGLRGAKTSLYGKIPIILGGSFVEGSYNIDVGWFVSMYEKNGRVEF